MRQTFISDFCERERRGKLFLQKVLCAFSARVKRERIFVCAVYVTDKNSLLGGDVYYSLGKNTLRF
jgi:hypothetical protein